MTSHQRWAERGQVGQCVMCGEEKRLWGQSLCVTCGKRRPELIARLKEDAIRALNREFHRYWDAHRR